MDICGNLTNDIGSPWSTNRNQWGSTKIQLKVSKFIDIDGNKKRQIMKRHESQPH